VSAASGLLPQDQWAVLIPITIRFMTGPPLNESARLASNCHPGPQQATELSGKARLAARAGALRPLWSPPSGLLSRQELHTGLLLSQRPSSQRSRSLVHARRRVRVDRRRRGFFGMRSLRRLEAAIAAQISVRFQDQPPSSSFVCKVERGVMKQGERTAVPQRWSRKTLGGSHAWKPRENKLQDQKAAEAELARKETNNDCNSPICSWNRSGLGQRFLKRVGTRRPQRTEIGRNFCAILLEEVKTTCCPRRAKPIWFCVGKPAPSPNST